MYYGAVIVLEVQSCLELPHPVRYFDARGYGSVFSKFCHEKKPDLMTRKNLLLAITAPGL
jgi:hypothetical protein